ncbi:hypothetical protein HG536_0D03540 [Torulaspora globosa]|uniref:DMAP1-binding domain-containing protein n=1 Tax=Torulaspora globosa TaxID=48254 RepID=A0A7G3ZH46_9SACH|nr:uncharacterized protein HG536_0D03540 [Torulaspora globosa]QLL32832.1 hypothetical protein HG536_0D03540 [Torulaspora globosa]
MPDLSVPVNLPIFLQNQLRDLVRDYTDEHLTLKGYETKREALLDQYANGDKSPLTPVKSAGQHKEIRGKKQNRASNAYQSPGCEPDNGSIVSSACQSPATDLGTVSSSQRRHRQSLYRVTTGNSLSGHSGSQLKGRASSVQLSIRSDEVSGDSYNPMIPLLPREKSAETFDSWRSILRGRYEHYNAETAIVSVSIKGKESLISWDRLYLRAEKIAHVLHKEHLKKMDKVLLWYNGHDIIEFTVALLGCFVAGIVAVPVSFETYSLGEIVEIIKATNGKHLLISNDCFNQIENLHSSSNHSKVKVIKSEFFSKVNFIKTDDLGAYSKAKSSPPQYEVPDVAYIEFTRTPLGRLSGVLMKHRVLCNQFRTLAKIASSRAMPHWKKSGIMRPFSKKENLSRFIILNSLDPTRSAGLVLGTLFNIFTGNLLISIDPRLLNTPGVYENIIDRYKADILLNDQLQLKQVVINYLDDPQSAISKKHRIDFSCIKCCFTSCTTIDTEVSDMIVHKWLKNLGCLDASVCYSPVLTLVDFGGVVLSLRDQLGKLDNFQIHNTKLRLHDELFVNKEKLRGNIIEPSLTAMMNSSSSFKDYLRLASFGFPIPDSTVCVVNPDDNTLVPDLTVGEIWAHSDSLADEFYQMDRVNEFVFKAKLNYTKMMELLSQQDTSMAARERLNTIMSICPSSTHFLRTKLMGFIHNGKIYVLSMIEDMFLQNQLVRLPNWAHTSDISRVKPSGTSDSEQSRGTDSPKRVVQTYYLQQVTETVVRTVNSVLEVSAFELNHNKAEHFLVVVVESMLAKVPAVQESHSSSIAERHKESFQRKMNDLSEQIYRILWIFHRIQPFCIMVVPPNSLPRRYCSLELANSTVEKNFFNGELEAKFVKFQVDNIVLDFLPHSSYYNESIFSEHLSKFRRSVLAEQSRDTNPSTMEEGLQVSRIDYREKSVDKRTGKILTDFDSITQILELRIEISGNDLSFSDGSDSTSSNNENNYHRKTTWSSFEAIVASFLKKIVASKTPLKAGDRVVIISENSVEYVAMVLACFYCKFIIIPHNSPDENNPESSVRKFANIVKAYGVKRIFTDAKANNLLENSSAIAKELKKYKHFFPKTSCFSKVKKKSGLTIKMFSNLLKEKYATKPGTDPSKIPCVLWIDEENDTDSNIHVNMTHSTLLNSCKILKETLQLSDNSPIYSISGHTHGMGFIISCMLGIYSGCATRLFSLSDVLCDPRSFLLPLQNSNVKDLYLNLQTLKLLVEKANLIVGNKIPTKVAKKNPSSILRRDVFKNVQNIMVPFSGRPQTLEVESLIRRNPAIMLNLTQISYVYQNHFNPHISLRSYLERPPVNLYLDPVALREGLIKTIGSSNTSFHGAIRVQDSGIVPVCTNVAIVNPETQLPCYDGEYGEIWCCSEGNAFSYSICNDAIGTNSKNALTKDPFITEQFKSKLQSEPDNGLTYLRTGDFGFIKKIRCKDSSNAEQELNLLFVLGRINETIEILGLTHFVDDLERTVVNAHKWIEKCIISKAGGLLVCLIKCMNPRYSYATLTALVVSELLRVHGIILDLCAFLRPESSTPTDWSTRRATMMGKWFDQSLDIEEQYGINFGENISIYLLSEFERGS